jgi:hypothetical protein
MDVPSAAGSYKESQISGKFDSRAHSMNPSYVRQDTTRAGKRFCALLRSMPIAALRKAKSSSPRRRRDAEKTTKEQKPENAEMAESAEKTTKKQKPENAEMAESAEKILCACLGVPSIQP